MKRNIANSITLSRAIFSILLYFIPLDEDLFFVVYAYCGISDVADGLIARKTHTTSEFGSKLDGACDLLFYSIMMYKIWPYLEWELPVSGWVLLWLILILRIVDYVFIGIRNKEFQSTHNVLNKVTGLLMFGLPFMTISRYFAAYCYLVELVALAAVIVEIMPIFRKRQGS